MTILTALHSSRIRNLMLGYAHNLAADNGCEVSDILALIGNLADSPSSTPSQPNPPSDVQTDGEVIAPITPSVEPIPEAPKPLPEDAGHSAASFENPPAEAKSSDQGALSSEPGEVQDRCVSTSPTPSPLPGDPADGADIPPNRVSAPSAAFSPAPKRTKGRAQQVEAAINEHPDWPDIKIAELIDCDPAYVRRTAARLGRELPSRREWHKAQQALTAEALRATQEKPAKVPEPPAPPSAPAKTKRPPAPTAGKKTLKTQVIELHAAQPDWTAQQIAQHLGRTSVGSISAYLFDARAEERAAEEQAHQDRLIAEAREREDQRNKVAARAKDGPTLTERIRTLHQQHPTWTATMLAKELGAKATSVSTILSQVRGKPAAPVEKPQFSGRREMVEHYGAIAKRLGKS